MRLGAGMIDLDRAQGTLANSVAPMIGTATGGMVSGADGAISPGAYARRLPGLLGVFALQGAYVARMPETALPRPGAWASLKPHLQLPPAVRSATLLAAPLLVATWTLMGFYGSLGPALVRGVMGSTSMLFGGLSLFALAGSGALAVWFLRRSPARNMMIAGAAALLVGVSTTLLAVSGGNATWFFVGTAVSGAGFGVGFQGAIRSVIPLAEAHQRAGVLSVLFLISYFAMGVPAVFAGIRVVYGGGVASAAREYGFMVIALAALALAGAVARVTRASR